MLETNYKHYGIFIAQMSNEPRCSEPNLRRNRAPCTCCTLQFRGYVTEITQTVPHAAITIFPVLMQSNNLLKPPHDARLPSKQTRRCATVWHLCIRLPSNRLIWNNIESVHRILCGNKLILCSSMLRTVCECAVRASNCPISQSQRANGCLVAVVDR